MNNIIKTSLETGPSALRQWVINNRADLRPFVECEIEFFHRFGTTDVAYLAWGLPLHESKNIAVIDISPNGEDGDWHGLLTKSDGTKELVKISTPLG